MVRLGTSVVCVLISLTCIVATEFAQNKFKLKDLSDESHALTTAFIRNITIRTPEDKMELASMANDFLVALDDASYTLNNVVSNMDSGQQRAIIGHGARLMNNLANDIQMAVLGDSEQLKEKLILSLEKFNQEVFHYGSVYIGYSSHFVHTQDTIKNHILLYALYKLKYRATFFETPNEDLEQIMSGSPLILAETIKRLHDDKTSKEEILRAIHLLTLITSKVMYTLENWVELNTNSSKEVQIVKDVSKGLTDVNRKLNSAINGNHDATYLKLELLRCYENGVEEVKKLARMKYPANVKGQGFIRSVLFDAITIGRVFSNNLKNVLSDN